MSRNLFRRQSDKLTNEDLILLVTDALRLTLPSTASNAKNPSELQVTSSAIPRSSSIGLMPVSAVHYSHGLMFSIVIWNPSAQRNRNIHASTADVIRVRMGFDVKIISFNICAITTIMKSATIPTLTPMFIPLPAPALVSNIPSQYAHIQSVPNTGLKRSRSYHEVLKSKTSLLLPSQHIPSTCARNTMSVHFPAA